MSRFAVCWRIFCEILLFYLERVCEIVEICLHHRAIAFFRYVLQIGFCENIGELFGDSISIGAFDNALSGDVQIDFETVDVDDSLKNINIKRVGCGCNCLFVDENIFII